MKRSRNRVLTVLAVASLAVLMWAQQSAQAQVFYGGYYPAPVYAAPYYAPAVYAAPAYYAAPVAAYPVPVYGSYPGPAPVVYGGYVAGYAPVAPLGYGVIYPRGGLEIEYKYRRGSCLFSRKNCDVNTIL